MAYSFYHNHHGLLDRWAIRMGQNQYTFNQLKEPSSGSTSVVRNSKVFHQVHREMVAEALSRAFDEVSDLLGYFPQPTFIEREVIRLRKNPRDVPNRYWWNQEITLRRRKLIRFTTVGTLESVPSEPDGRINVAYTPKRSTVTLKNVEKNDITELKDKVIFSLLQGERKLSEDTDSISPISDTNLLTISKTNPYITVNGNGYDYNFQVPVWNLVRYPARFQEFINHITSGEELEFNNNDDNVYCIDSSNDPDENELVNATIKLQEFVDEGSVKLLYRPIDETKGAGILRCNVEPIVTDTEKSKFFLKYENHNVSQSEYVPYGVEVTYESGEPYQPDANMNSALEWAIITLANTYIDQNLPVGNNASTLWNEHRSPVYDERRRVKNPQFINPLGDLIGHARAWNIIVQKYDRIKGNAKNLVGY